MTSILAIWPMDGAPVSQEQIEAMLSPVAYRGGSGSAIERSGPVILGQQRLHITSEDPPGLLPFTQDNITLVADARLDDRDFLASKLRLSTQCSDAVLLIEAWKKWGRDCPSHINGDFAFVIWDGNAKSLFAARDCMGVRPLYYAQVGSLLCIASETRQLAAHPLVTKGLSRDALWMWVMGQYDVTLPLFKNVKGLAAGHCIIAKDGRFEAREYWRFSQVRPLIYKDQDQYFEHFKTLFADCVRDRLRTDGSVIGTMLSGGMDSTSVSAMANVQTQKPLLPYSFKFNSLKDCDESVYSEAVARKCGIKANMVDCEAFWLLKGAFQSDQAGEDPFQCWDLMDQYIMEDLAGRGGKVLLTGHGGDSLMTGLGVASLLAADVRRGNIKALFEMVGFLRSNQRSVFKGLVSNLMSPALSGSWRYRLKNLAGRGRALPSWIPRDHHKDYKRVEERLFSWPDVFSDWDRQQAWQLIMPVSTGVRRAIHWYQRMAAPYGIEVRHPLYDKRLAEFMLAIPQKLVRYKGWRKGFLRQAMEDFLPPEVAWRKDKPTLAAYYHYGIKKEAEAIFQGVETNKLSEMGFIDKRALAEAIQQYLAGDPSRVVADFLPVLQTDLWLKHL